MKKGKIEISINPTKRSTMEYIDANGVTHVVEGANVRECMLQVNKLRGR